MTLIMRDLYIIMQTNSSRWEIDEWNSWKCIKSKVTCNNDLESAFLD